MSPLPCHPASLRTLSILCLSAGTMLMQQLSCGGSRCSRLQCRQQQCGLEQSKLPEALCTRGSPVLLEFFKPGQQQNISPCCMCPVKPRLILPRSQAQRCPAPWFTQRTILLQPDDVTLSSYGHLHHRLQFIVTFYLKRIWTCPYTYPCIYSYGFNGKKFSCLQH